MLLFLVLIIISCFSAFLYRIGGSSKEDAKKHFPWYPSWAVNTKARDLGCPAFTLLGVLAVGITASWWVHALAFVLMFGAMCTYWDSLLGEDNFYVHGLAIGFAYLVYAIAGSIGWLPFVMRTITLALFMGIWCGYFKNDFVEEYGRGGILPITLLFFI